MEYDADGEALRTALVQALKKTGFITDPAIESAFQSVPRHLFLPGVPVDQAYKDAAILTKQLDQRPVSSSSQPSMMALMLRQLSLEPGCRVLEVGAGTGFNAALMAHIVGPGGSVATVEIDDDLAQQARKNLAAAGYDRVQVVCADGGLGFPEHAPYDRIILTVGAADIAPAWRDQLKPGGLLVVPLSLADGIFKSIAFEKMSDCLSSRSSLDCAFLMLRGIYAVPGPSPMTIGSEPGLQLYLSDEKANAVDGREVYRIITGSSRDMPTGIETTALKLATRFWTWISLKEKPDEQWTHCSIVATGPFADRGIVPYLYGLAGKAVSTTGLIGKRGMALIMRPPGSRPLSQLPVDDRPFELFVRCFGADDGPAERLIGQLEAWTAAGCPPDPDRIKVRAYPKDRDYEPKANELVIEKPNIRIVLELS